MSSFTTTSHVMPIETQGALIISVMLATVCTFIEAVLAHTFSETIGTSVIDGTEEEEVTELTWVQVVEDQSTDQTTPGWGNRRIMSKLAPTTEYTMMQSVFSTQTPNRSDQSHQNTEGKNKSTRRLETANFLHSMHAHT
jgi:hypothetical protein